MNRLNAFLLCVSSMSMAGAVYANTPNQAGNIGPQDYIDKWQLQDMGFPNEGYFDIADRPEYNPNELSQTVTFWFNIPGATSIQQVLQKGNTTSGHHGWSMFTANNNLYYRINVGGQRADLSASFDGLDFDQWHHFTAVVDQDKGRLEAWINGKKLDKESGEYVSEFVPGILNSTSPIRAHQKASGYMIDDLRIYDRALKNPEAKSFINHKNQAPVGDLTAEQVQETTYRFSASNSVDPEGDELQYIWDFGNGNLQFGEFIEHDFVWGGTYEVNLMVVDPWKNMDVVTQSLVVEGDPAPIRETTVFTPGDDGYKCYRIPTILKSGNGDLLALAEGRVNGCGDHGDIDVVMKRSSDNGMTWGDLELMADFGSHAAQNVSGVYDEFYPHVDQSGNPILDENGKQKMGKLIVAWNNADGGEGAVADDNNPAQRWALIRTSLDHGYTWSDPIDITDQVRVPGQKMQLPPTGHAIQLTTDAAKDAGYHGRLFFAGQYNPVGAMSAIYNENYAYWSDDHGESWEIGGLIAGESLNEVQAVELANGDIMFNSRNYRPTAAKRRAITISQDGGNTFGPTVEDDELIEPTVASAIIRYTREDTDGVNRLLFSNPHSQSSRMNLMVKMSYDEGETWPVRKVINPGSAQYSDLVIQDDMNIGVFYEAEGLHLRYASMTLDYITDGKDDLIGEEFEVEGLAQIINGSLSINGITIQTNGNTEFDDGLTLDNMHGEWVEIEGVWIGQQFIAHEIEKEDKEDELELRALVEGNSVFGYNASDLSLAPFNNQWVELECDFDGQQLSNCELD